MAINSRLAAGLCLLVLLAQAAWAHPGSGIVVDEGGYVWFMDTGYGLWQIDPTGHLTAQAGPGGHFLAIDRQERYEEKHFAALAPGDVEVARFDPRLIVATSYPVTFGSDGVFYYPQVAEKGRVRIMRMEPGKAAEPFADLPPAREVGGNGEPVEWIWGIAAGPAGSIYYTEQQAVRRIAPDGTVSTVVEKIVVPDCERPEALKDAPSKTNLYGLDVAADGTVYVAASGCSAVLKISPDGNVAVAARSTDRWSPMGVAVAGDTLYVLEYDYVDSDDRADWYPRVRRVDPDGTITIVAQVEKRPETSAAKPLTLTRNVLAGVVQPARTHAAIVHFPIVLFLISVPAGIAALCMPQRRLPRVQLLVLFATIVALCWAAESSGETAERQIPYGEDGVPGVAWEYLRQHTTYASYLMRFALAGLVLAGAALLPAGWRGMKSTRIALLSLVLCAAVGGSATAIVAAHYGGELVYGQGLGSDTLHDYLEEKSRANREARQVVARAHGAADSDADAVAAPLAGKEPGEERTIAGTVLCWCPPGRFDMGSPLSEPERRPFESQVTVTLSNGFWTGKYEVTQGDWKRVVGKLPGETTDELPAGDELPVGNVNYAEAEDYCAKLTKRARDAGELPAGWEFRLPTEAQWEYACRAGTTTATSFGDSIGSKQANIKGDQPYRGAEPGPTLGRAAKVGSYPANPWGIHDMHGNTCEWCRDWAHRRYPGGTDPDLHDSQATAARNESGSYSRSRRGSCWADPAWASRSAFRQRFEPERRYDHIGFRVVLVRL